MNKYRLRSTGQVVTEAEYRALTPNISYPAVLVPEDADVIFYAPPPTTDAASRAVASGIEQVPLQSGALVWQTAYTVVSIPQEEIDAALATAKVAKNAQINLWRASANQTVFPHLGKNIACDALSRSDIDAVAGSVSLTGAFPVGFPGAWKYTDNTYLMLPDVQAFKEMYASMTQAGTVNFARSQTLKTALAAATTLAEVNALSWEE